MTIACNFCGAEATDEDTIFVQGRDAFICEHCVKQANTLINRKKRSKP